jgi:hypothetical protein
MNNINTYKLTYLFAETNNVSLVQQPDTIVQKQVKDSIKASALGIDPLFLEIERKAQEVEEFREQAAIVRLRVPKPLPKEPVDTTCHICPAGEPLSLQQLATSTNSNVNPFELPYLYDREYIQNVEYKPKPVFFETSKTENHANASSDLKILPRAERNSTADWVLLPLIAIILTLGFLKNSFYQQLSVFFRSTVFFFVSNKITRESSVLWNRIFFSLDIIFFISIPLLATLISPLINSNNGGDYNIIILALYILIGLIAFRIFRFASIHFIGYISNNSEVFKTLYTNQLLYARVLGVIIVPFLIIIGYSNESVRPFALYFLLAITVIVLFFRLIRTLQVFISRGFSLFYLILYLCALEIIPILIIYNEVFGE